MRMQIAKATHPSCLLSDASAARWGAKGWGTRKGEQQIPHPIRKKRGYHPNTRKTGVCWGPRLDSG